ncbi:MAG: PAS domain S-box protein, partial [Actinobacteria bacterium]|nr:PAS domain S-box protein [Actinomycetota bacterium]
MLTDHDSMYDLRVRLHWLMASRVVVVTLLLGLSIAFQVGRGELVPTFYRLIIATYAITIIYSVTLRYLSTTPQLVRFAYCQILVDLLLETFLVAKTGVVDSPFSMLYVVTVSLGSLILGRRGGVTTAGVSVILFGTLTNAQLYGVVEAEGWLPPSRLPIAETFHTFGVHGLAVIVVGLLSGTLAEQLRRSDQSRVEKEQGLEKLRAFHENVIQSISSGVFTTDVTGRITTFNLAAQEVTGSRFHSVQNRLWWEAFNWEQADLFVTDPAALTGPHRFEMEGKRADGIRVVLGMTLSPLTEHGVQTGLVGVFKDLTQVRDMEEEMRRREWLATLGEMSAGMAHEIRNPLAALAGSMQMLRRDHPMDDTSGRLMDIAIREATRLDAIITEFLLYARPPALNLKECDINALVKETLDLLRHEAQSRANLVLEVHHGP